MKMSGLNSRLLVPTCQPRALLQPIYLRAAIVMFCVRTQETMPYYHPRDVFHVLQGSVLGSQHGLANCLCRLASHGVEKFDIRQYSPFSSQNLRLFWLSSRNLMEGGPSKAIISAYRLAWSGSVSRLEVSEKCPFWKSVHAWTQNEMIFRKRKGRHIIPVKIGSYHLARGPNINFVIPFHLQHHFWFSIQTWHGKPDLIAAFCYSGLSKIREYRLPS
jgi:hypothetical protein